jgi:pantothenate kinase
VTLELNRLYHAAQHEIHPRLPTLDPSHPDPSQPNIAVALPLDGYHLTRKQLSEMPNAEEAIFRRGAAFTFDGNAYLKLVEKLRRPIEAGHPTIYAPSFDHAVKDPVPNDIAIYSTTRIILLEGNYLALNTPPWSNAAKLMDELWFVETSVETATARLVGRHVAAGISPDPEHALKRITESDMRNGREIIEGRLECQEVIESVEDEEWKMNDLKESEGRLSQELERKPRRERLDSLTEMVDAGVGL